jgi:prepilin-type processing-associated H-X9-DG protein
MLLLSGCRPQPSRGPGQAERALCVWNLRRIAVSAILYAQEHQERMLKARGGRDALLQLDPYLQGKSVAAACPETGKAYVFNTALSDHPRPPTGVRAATPVFKDAEPHSDGTVTVAFLDGHVKKVPGAQAAALGGTFR